MSAFNAVPLKRRVRPPQGSGSHNIAGTYPSSIAHSYMLSILLLVQFISWFPWQFFTIFNETAAVESDLDSNVS